MVSRGPFEVPGFRVAAEASGMRYQGRPDLAWICTESVEGAVAAGVFTRNRFTAAPVQLCREHLKSDRICSILVNAGIANACTGDEGLEKAREMARIAGESLGVDPKTVLVASTGIIGQQVRLGPVRQSISTLRNTLRPDAWEEVARAIMTTDTQPKMASTRILLGGREVTVGGVAKGSGMIAPDMATLLAFVCTDAAVGKGVLEHWVRAGADRSFNRITVDGDTSTNDTLLVLAGGAAGNPVLSALDSPDSRLFGEALEAVLLDLARRIVLDGEGATKFIELHVTGAPDAESARRVAFTVAHSPLVKTAFFGEDANWGRIVAAAGRADVPLDPQQVTLHFGDVCVFKGGKPIEGVDVEEKAAGVFRQKEIPVHLDLGMGGFDFVAYTCDLSYDYVKINASYRS
ncbi:MAG TPA: bifunctional glutamate N-acetyltransferase/amino-acid acetyltransferase ArgJ [Syntrophobacteraceae bacterium]|nr:bifunctional glutamate N-acetyltransferase/amino-acid acetyltransferase ArgJ [Syntrophobacteraceae bacterium]